MLYQLVCIANKEASQIPFLGEYVTFDHDTSALATQYCATAGVP